MTLDIRAKVFSDRGPVISGGFSDDHVQGTGLIRTRGEVVLDGLITLRPGDTIRLGYEKGGRTTRIPRALRVLSSFANPFRRQTTVSVGCKLTMLETLRENKQQLAAEDEENAGIPCSEYGKIPINITFTSIATTCLAELGITLRGGLGLVGSAAIESFDYSSGYVQILSDILYSQSKVGYLDADEQLVVVDLAAGSGDAPVLDEDDVIDVSPIRSGDYPPDVVLVEYSYNRFKEPDPNEVDNEEERQKRDWELDLTQGELEYVYVTYNDGDDVQLFTHYPLSISRTTYDQLDRVLTREERTSTHSAKINSAYVSELLEETGALGPNVGISEETTITQFIYQYAAENLVVPPDDLAPCDYWYSVKTLFNEARDSQPIAQVTTRTASDLAIVGAMNMPSYYYPDGALHPGNADYPVEITRIEFERDDAYIGQIERDRLGLSSSLTYLDSSSDGITKTKTYRQTCYAMTQPGQQGLAKMAEDIDSVNDAVVMLAIGREMVNTGVSVETHYDRYYGVQRRPSLANRKKKQFYKDPRESVSRTEYIYGSAGVSITTSYNMPWAPDDRIQYTAGSSTPYLLEASIAPDLARKFGRIQQRLTYGHRMGFAVQTVPDRLPPYAASLATLRLGGILAQYMVNAQSWTFDSNGIVASVDMVYLGGIGATSEAYRTPSPWAPVQDGITQLPIAPAVTTNPAPAAANSIETPSGFDATAPGDIFDTLPTTTAPVYEKQVTVDALVPAFEEVIVNTFTTFIGAAVQRTLIFVPLDDRNAAPTVRVGTSAESYLYPPRDTAPSVVLGNDAARVMSFSLVAGDAAPLAGSGVTTSTPSGWTQVYNGNVDDTPLEITGMPFTFTFNGVGYTSFWLSPNGYITFGSGSSEYTGLGNTNPALPKIFINATDDSMQKVYVRSTDNTFRVRVEGNTEPGGTSGSARVHEIAFFNPDANQGYNDVEVRMGDMPDTTGLFNVYSSSAVLSTDTATPGANKSWLFFDGDGTGVTYAILPAYSYTPIE